MVPLIDISSFRNLIGTAAKPIQPLAGREKAPAGGQVYAQAEILRQQTHVHPDPPPALRAKEASAFRPFSPKEKGTGI